MFVYTEEDIERVREVSEEKAIDDAAEWLTRFYPGCNEALIHAEAPNVVAEAKRLGLVSERDIYNYLAMRLVHGFDIADDADMLAVIKDPDIDANDRMNHFILRKIKTPAFWRKSLYFRLPDSTDEQLGNQE